MSGKYALIIGNTEYTDAGLAKLTAPCKDAEDLARVLKDENICAFDEVKVLLNQTASVVNETIDEFFDQKKPNDLLVLYFSGHGVRDELGALYLAVRNTNRFRLRSTAIKSDYIREIMDQSRSKRQVLILDCCNSGAFAQGTKAAVGVSIGTASAFEGTGFGRVVLTASDSTQFAWQGDGFIGEMENSLFTHFLVKGLEGEADDDGDGRITIDELYDYAYEEILSITPKQTPGKWSYKQQGEIVLRQNIRIEDVKPVPLPAEIIHAMESPLSYVREGVVEQLGKLLSGKNIRLAHSAKEALERIAKEDDSRRVSQRAARLLESVRKEEHKAESEKAGEGSHVASLQEPVQEPASSEKMSAERKAGEVAPLVTVQNAGKDSLTSVKNVGESAERAGQAQAQRQVADKIAIPQYRPAKSPLFRFALVGGSIFILILCGLAATAFLRAMFGGFAQTLSPSTETAVATQEQISTSTPQLTATPRPAATVTPNVLATQQYTEFYSQIQDYQNKGYISTLQGEYVALSDFSESIAKLNWIGGHTIAYNQNVSDFVLSAHFSWSTAVQTTDESGCGIWFAVQESGDSYFVFLDKSRIYFLRFDASQGRYTQEVGKTRGTGKVSFGNPAEADFSLVVNGNHAYVHVGEKFVGEYNLPADSITEGQLGYTVLSGTNKDYGTRCEITSAKLWIVGQ